MVEYASDEEALKAECQTVNKDKTRALEQLKRLEGELERAKGREEGLEGEVSLLEGEMGRAKDEGGRLRGEVGKLQGDVRGGLEREVSWQAASFRLALLSGACKNVTI